MQVDEPLIKQTAKKYHCAWIDCPYDFPLVYRVNVVYMDSDIAGRTWTVENVYFHILGSAQAFQTLPPTYSEISLGYLRQGRQASLEIMFVAFQLKFKISS